MYSESMARNIQARRFCVGISVLCALAVAQMNVAEVSGVIEDPAGGAVGHAVVTAVNTETQLKYASVTDDSGRYRLAQLPPGDYSLRVSANGFEEAVQRHLILHAGE